MNRLRHLVCRGLGAALLSLWAWGAASATTVSTEQAVDPPGRVGRIAELQGTAWLYHPADGDWLAAERNRPLTGGDRLATEAGARAEVQIGSTTLRLDGGSELEVLRLDDERIVLKLHDGSAALRLRSPEAVPEFELQTAEGRFTTQRTGRYRFDRDNQASFVTVDSGQATYEGQGSALPVQAGQKAEFWVDGAGVAQYRLLEPSRDAFAAWVGERDRAEDGSLAQRYVSPEMTGAEELDRYGQWQNDAEYGTLWVPRQVAPGWAPYTMGRWVWVAPWGWTWVDEAPWGFAPFHYGRWVWHGSRWCWSPGHYVRRPIYAPALVAWIAGPGLRATLGTGPTIGWVPLAPREVYVPAYRVSPGYVRNVNITHVVNITNLTTIVNNPQQAVEGRDFRNRKFPHGVTFVPASTLSTRAPVAPAARTLREQPEVREIERGRPRERAPALVAPPATLAPVTPPAPGFAEGPRRPPPGVRRDDRRDDWRNDRRDDRRDDRVDVRPAPRRDSPRLVEPTPEPVLRQPALPERREAPTLREREPVARPVQPPRPAQPVTPREPPPPREPPAVREAPREPPALREAPREPPRQAPRAQREPREPREARPNPGGRQRAD